MPTLEEKAAAFDLLADALLVPAELATAKATLAALEQLVVERNDARNDLEEVYMEMAAETRAREQLPEAEPFRKALGMIYNSLVLLGPSLSAPQLLLCPMDWCKYWKHPEWEQRWVLSTPEDKERTIASLRARTEQLIEWMNANGRDSTHVAEQLSLMWQPEDDDAYAS